MSDKQDTGTHKKGLLQLPDDILIMILKLLPGYELMSVSMAYSKLNLLRLGTKVLWNDVDFTGHAFKLDQMSEVLEYLHEETNSLTLQGLGYMNHGWTHIKPRTPEESAMCNITGPLLTGLSSHCENLKHLTLKKAWLPFGSKIKLEHFPSSLTHLTLIDCKIYHRLFENFENTLPILKYLRVEDVTHFCEANWAAIKKHKNIETLIVRKCSGIFDAPYKLKDELPSLKILDLSESGMSNVGYCSIFYLLPLRELSLSCHIDGFLYTGSEHRKAKLFVGGGGGDDRNLLRESLEKLTFVRSTLDDEALEIIARECTNLKHVSLLKCKGISDVGVTIFENMLKEKNSSCEVVYEEANDEDTVETPMRARD